MSRAEFIDRDELMTRIDGDLGLFAELIDIFVEDLPERLGELRRAVREGDTEALHRAAHAFKGSVGNFAAHGVFETARRLDEMARSGTVSSAEPVLEQLCKEVEQLVPALRELHEELRAP